MVIGFHQSNTQRVCAGMGSVYLPEKAMFIYEYIRENSKEQFFFQVSGNEIHKNINSLITVRYKWAGVLIVPSPLEAHAAVLKCKWDTCRHLIWMSLGCRSVLLFITSINFYCYMVYRKKAWLIYKYIYLLGFFF